MVSLTQGQFISTKMDTQDIQKQLRKAGLRPTRQRIALAELLFGCGDRHVNAEILHEEALEHNIPVSLATIYNTLHQFTGAGLLREVAVDGTRAYFDTNISNHHHFFVEDNEEVMDIPGNPTLLSKIPEPPEGMEVVRVDCIVRVRHKKNRS